MDTRIDILVVAYKNIQRFMKKNYSLISDNNIRIIIADNNNNNIKECRNDNVIYVNMGANMGYGTAVNRVLKYSKSKFVMICNDDIVFKKDFFTTIYREMEFYERGNIGLIGFNVISEKTERRGLHRQLYSIPLILFHFSIFPLILSLFSRGNGYIGGYETIHYHKSSKYVKGVSGSCFMCGRDILLGLGGFDEKFFLTYEETELFRRVLKAGYLIYYESSAIVYHKHGFSASGISLRESYRSMHVYLEKHYPKWAVISAKLYIFIWLSIRALFSKKKRNEIKYFLLKQ